MLRDRGKGLEKMVFPLPLSLKSCLVKLFCNEAGIYICTGEFSISCAEDVFLCAVIKREEVLKNKNVRVQVSTIDLYYVSTITRLQNSCFISLNKNLTLLTKASTFSFFEKPKSKSSIAIH